MKVHGKDPIDRPDSVGPVARLDRPRKPSETEASPDRVELSPAARERVAIREAALRAPDVRAELVAGVRDRIASGSYEPDLRVVARRLLEDLGVLR